MPLLVWPAALVGVWCAASALAALVVGPALRRRAAATGRTQATEPTGPAEPTGPGTVGSAGAAGAAGSAQPVPSPRGAPLDPLDTGPMRMWLAELPEVPEPRRASPSRTV